MNAAFQPRIEATANTVLEESALQIVSIPHAHSLFYFGHHVFHQGHSAQ
jgi:hypothetical protein